MNIKDIAKMEDQGDVKGLSLVLDHSNAELRSAAASALCKVGDEQAVASLIETLSNDDAWVVRRYAAEALGNIGSQEGVESLELALNNDPFVCNITGRRVVRIVAEEALRKIEKAKTATWPLDRLLACQWSTSDFSDDIRGLIKILRGHCSSIEDRDVSKCKEAIENLAREKDPVIAEAMCYAALSANHYEVRESAVDVLKGITTPEITQILCDALHYDRKSPKPVAEALDALKVIGDERATSEIVRFLVDFRDTWRMPDVAVGDLLTLGAYLDKEKSICLYACHALAALGGSEAIIALESILSDSYWSNYSEIQEELPRLIARAKR